MTGEGYDQHRTYCANYKALLGPRKSVREVDDPVIGSSLFRGLLSIPGFSSLWLGFDENPLARAI